jgi:hypothetical protein
MGRNYDEVIADMLIELAEIRKRMEKSDKGMDLTIRRMVKAEARLESGERRMELFDKKLERSIEDQIQFSRMQSKMNQYFLKQIRNR